MLFERINDFLYYFFIFIFCTGFFIVVWLIFRICCFGFFYIRFSVMDNFFRIINEIRGEIVFVLFIDGDGSGESS